MSDDEGPIYAGFVTRATGLVVDEVLILVIGVAGVIGAGLVLDAVIPGGVSIDLASILGRGITVLADAYNIIPDGSLQPETANSQLARAIFGSGTPFYYILQIATMLIASTLLSTLTLTATILLSAGWNWT